MLLIVDANVLIDYAKADVSVLGLVVRACSQSAAQGMQGQRGPGAVGAPVDTGAGAHGGHGRGPGDRVATAIGAANQWIGAEGVAKFSRTVHGR